MDFEVLKPGNTSNKPLIFGCSAVVEADSGPTDIFVLKSVLES